ncbi:hypothetical protein ASF36_08315 [Methylobacterium sp. Leaf90]|nr:hypothetical protein ASF36_08315 [Methylobacterium sp. Leaf90]
MRLILVRGQAIKLALLDDLTLVNEHAERLKEGPGASLHAIGGRKAVIHYVLNNISAFYRPLLCNYLQNGRLHNATLMHDCVWRPRLPGKTIIIVVFFKLALAHHFTKGIIKRPAIGPDIFL